MRWLGKLFGCSHARTTFPLTKRSRCYVVCLDCGKEFAYDWHAMRIARGETTPILNEKADA